jgi:hypothetical protein
MICSSNNENPGTVPGFCQAFRDVLVVVAEAEHLRVLDAVQAGVDEQNPGTVPEFCRAEDCKWGFLSRRLANPQPEPKMSGGGAALTTG